MKENGRDQVWLTLGIFCAFVILPCAGYGADLTIGNTVSVNGNMNATSFSGDGSGLTNVPGQSSGLVVHDANGQALGVTMGLAQGTYGGFTWEIANGGYYKWNYPAILSQTIFIPSLNRQIIINLGSGFPEFGLSSAQHFFYPTSDCSGQAYGGPIASYQIYWSPVYPSSPGPFERMAFYTGQGKPSYMDIYSFSSNYPNFGWMYDCNNLYPAPTFPVSGLFVPLNEISLPFTVPVQLPLQFTN
jgi:hypothetical protein